MTDHVLYTNNDSDVPLSIKDQHNDIVLSLCKNCCAGEIELVQYPSCEQFLNRDNNDQ